MLNRSRLLVTCILSFVLLLKSQAFGQAAPKRFLISEAGAVGDGKTLNTVAIQGLIERVASGGGGVVVVPAGTFQSGALFFKQGVDLQIEKDGILQGTANPADYPQINTRWEGVERLWTCAFLNFDHMTGVHVGGEGMIDGSGDVWMARFPRGRGRGRGGATQPSTQGSGRRGGRRAGGDAGGGQGVSGQVESAATLPSGAATRPGQLGRPRLICFSNCEGVHIADLHLKNQAVWCLHILYSQHVVVDNLNIRATLYIPSSDGMDIDSSRDVQVSRCDIACYDDDIAIKCGKDTDGLRVNRPSENITISDCAIGIGGGICMGSEISGSIRHVLVQRCTFNGTDQTARFKSQPSRGGVVEDIVFRDITLNDARSAFDMNLAWRMVGPALPPANPLSLVHNIRLVNFHGTVGSVGRVEGLKDGPIRDVRFENCNITAQRGLRISNALDIDTSGLHLKVSEGEAIITVAPATQPSRLQ